MPAAKPPKKKRPAPKNAPRKKAGLTAMQARFVELLVVEGKRGTDAAIGAGYSEKHAATIAYNLIHKNEFVKQAITERREALSMRSLATRDRWEEEVCRLAFFDVRDILEADGSLKLITDMPEDARRALQGIEVAEIFAGQGEQKTAIGLMKKVRISNKKEALELLAKANGWVIDRKSLEGPGGGPVPMQVVDDLDLSRLSMEELQTLKALREKARREA